MPKLIIGSMIALAVIAFSGCSVKSPASSTCIGCEGLPECVPGPYGDCNDNK